MHENLLDTVPHILQDGPRRSVIATESHKLRHKHSTPDGLDATADSRREHGVWKCSLAVDLRARELEQSGFQEAGHRRACIKWSQYLGFGPQARRNAQCLSFTRGERTS